MSVKRSARAKSKTGTFRACVGVATTVASHVVAGVSLCAVQAKTLAFRRLPTSEPRLRAAVVVSLLASLAIAATDKKPILNVPLGLKLGLWQMTYSTERIGPAAIHSIRPELLAKMSPEQRKRTEARLKSRALQGLQIETRQYCVTEDRLRKAVFSNSEIGTPCPRTFLISTAKIQQFHDECVGSSSKRTVDGHFEAVDFDTLRGSLKVKADGGSRSITSVDIVGRWVAADCGDEPQ